MSSESLASITQAVVVGDADTTMKLARASLSSGTDPLVIINQGLVPGMEIAGDKFSSGEYFLPHLLVAAKAMQEAMTLLEPELLARDQQVEKAGTVVLGTVHGDIHEIGKSLVGTMLTANGFHVHDLGVDVPVEQFLAKIEETDADLVGLSALLTTTMVVQREVIEALIKAGLRDNVKVMVGGAPVSLEWAEEIGADGYAEDAIAAVRVARTILGK